MQPFQSDKTLHNLFLGLEQLFPFGLVELFYFPEPAQRLIRLAEMIQIKVPETIHRIHANTGKHAIRGNKLEQRTFNLFVSLHPEQDVAFIQKDDPFIHQLQGVGQVECFQSALVLLDFETASDKKRNLVEGLFFFNLPEQSSQSCECFIVAAR